MSIDAITYATPFARGALSRKEVIAFERAVRTNLRDTTRRIRKATRMARCGSTIEQLVVATDFTRKFCAALYAEEERKKTTRDMRQFILDRDGYRCVRCASQTRLCMDHIRPLYHGGRSVIENLQTLCGACNSSKRHKLPGAA